MKNMDHQAARSLQEQVCHGRLSQQERLGKLELITSELQAQSVWLKEPNFTELSNKDLKVLFDLYDEYFFEGMCGRVARSASDKFSFRLSKRMTNAGGKTTREQYRNPQTGHAHTDFEIAVSVTLLFESFRTQQDLQNVGGLVCTDRLTALLRIMEHEIVHLIEMLLWYDSSCAKQRFKSIVWRFFGHVESNHQLLTPTDTARKYAGIQAGDRVRFVFEGKPFVGIVNRITRRATILVKDKNGVPYDDGHKYKKFYVPVAMLKKVG